MLSAAPCIKIMYLNVRFSLILIMLGAHKRMNYLPENKFFLPLYTTLLVDHFPVIRSTIVNSG